MNRRALTLALVVLTAAAAAAVETGRYRLLSASDSTKLILVSKIPDKTKYVLDAATAKITLDGKPAEFSSLQAFAVITLSFELKKSTKNGIDIDGIATEIKISNPEKRPASPSKQLR